MDTSNIIALLGLFLSIAAFIISFIANWRSRKLDNVLKQKELDIKNKAEEDAQKADIEVNTVDAPKGQMDILRFYNKGNSAALNINFSIPSDPEDLISLNMTDDYLPYPKLLPQQNFDVRYYCSSHKPHQTILITWNDDFGKNRVKEMVIDM